MQRDMKYIHSVLCQRMNSLNWVPKPKKLIFTYGVHSSAHVFVYAI